MKTVDARGLKCPMPLILTKRALLGSDAGETLEILIDNDTSLKNVSRFLSEHGMDMQTQHDGSLYRLRVSKTGTLTEQADAEAYCEPPESGEGGYVACLSRHIHGPGSDELAGRLIHMFLNTLPDIDRKPGTLVFLNSSIFLTLKDSPVLDVLKRLEAGGMRILVCGSCLEFFNRKEELAVGTVSNMYEILTLMSKAPKVLYP